MMTKTQLSNESSAMRISKETFHEIYEKYGHCVLKFSHFNTNDLTLRYLYIDENGTRIEAVFGGSERELREVGEVSVYKQMNNHIVLKEYYPTVLVIDNQVYIRGMDEEH